MPTPVLSAVSTPQPWWQQPALTVHLDPKASDARTGDLFVGIGVQGQGSGCTALNHKTTLAATGQGWAAQSVSDYVLNAPEATRAAWRACFPQGMASVKRVVVEDASLDTCMALLLFARLVSPEATPTGAATAPTLGAVQSHWTPDDGASPRLRAWVDYTAAWEAGRYIDGADFSLSAGCQMAALAHNSLALLSTTTPPQQRDDMVARALRDCLTLLDAYIAGCDQAVDAPPPRHLPEFALASAQLDFEHQLYAQALKHGVQTQLLLPMKGSARKLLVDALIVDDLEMSGVLKVLARNDRVNSPTRHGFAVLALHRPKEAGSGNDMVISVDPAVGVDLQPLWHRLEALEDKAWGTERPCDTPRAGIAHYTDPASGKPRAGAPNQPWYDEGGKYSLIAAPKNLTSGRPGSRLGWHQDVLPALWALFKPFDEPRLTAVTPAAAGRRVVCAEWPGGRPQAANGMPVVQQWLADASAPARGAHPGEFPALTSLSIRAVPGGEVIAHPGGVTLSVDWTATAFDPVLKTTARTMAQVADAYDQLLHTGTLRKLDQELRRLLDANGRAGEKQLLALRQATLALKQQLIGLALQEEQARQGRGHRALLDALEQAWDLSDARYRLWDTASRMEELLQQAQAVHQARSHFLMTHIVSAAGAFVFVHELIGVLANVWTMNEFERLAMVATKLGVEPAQVAELLRNASLSDAFDWGAVAACALILTGALAMAGRKWWGSSQSAPTATPNARPARRRPRRRNRARGA